MLFQKSLTSTTDFYNETLASVRLHRLHSSSFDNFRLNSKKAWQGSIYVQNPMNSLISGRLIQRNATIPLRKSEHLLLSTC